MKARTKALAGITVAAMVVTSAYVVGWLSGRAGHDLRLLPEVQAAGGKVTDPRGTAPDRYVYYPGTEKLAKDEIRVIACGTGMPSARRGQADPDPGKAAWTLGHGDRIQIPEGQSGFPHDRTNHRYQTFRLAPGHGLEALR